MSNYIESGGCEGVQPDSCDCGRPDKLDWAILVFFVLLVWPKAIARLRVALTICRRIMIPTGEN